MPRKARPVQTSGIVATPRTPKIPIVDPVGLLERFKDYPAIEVITRRFNDPTDPGSLPILLKDEDAHCCTDTGHQDLLPSGATVCPIRALIPDEINKPRRTGPRCGKPVRVWYVRWVNVTWEGRWAAIKAKGYVPVEIADLKDEQDVADLVRQPESGGQLYVRRGDRGQEILCKMPLELFTYIKRQQRDAYAKRNNSKKAMVSDLAEAAGAELGDEAGQTIHDGGIRVESMKRTKTTLGEESADNDAIDA